MEKNAVEAEINSAPQTDATTFAFASVCILLQVLLCSTLSTWQRRHLKTYLLFTVVISVATRKKKKQTFTSKFGKEHNKKKHSEHFKPFTQLRNFSDSNANIFSFNWNYDKIKSTGYAKLLGRLQKFCILHFCKQFVCFSVFFIFTKISSYSFFRYVCTHLFKTIFLSQ